uniref:Secreted protein n=1 Tax=Rhizophora mucronata TaxID=61149 RepID=A0A2P2NPH1_RHIMU
MTPECRVFTWMVIPFLWLGWTGECGQKTKEEHITSGMPYFAALWRFILGRGQQSLCHLTMLEYGILE